MNKAKLFFGGFLQVSLVSGNTYAIKSDSEGMMFVIAVMIGWVWTGNVKRVGISSGSDRAAYSLGSGVGCVFGSTNKKPR